MPNRTEENFYFCHFVTILPTNPRPTTRTLTLEPWIQNVGSGLLDYPDNGFSLPARCLIVKNIVLIIQIPTWKIVPRPYTITSDLEMMNFTFQRGFLAHHNGCFWWMCTSNWNFLMNIHLIFTKNIEKT